MSDTKPLIAVVVPCYNEEEMLPISAPRILAVLDRLAAEGAIDGDSYVMCCDDGSKDATWDVIKALNASDKRVKGLSLAHNRGHQNVLMAGLMAVADRCDAAISIDADLQDDPEAMAEMVRCFRDGAEIVYGVRGDRSTDTWFKRVTARGFYSFQNAMGLETVYDHADYRLMSGRALRMLGAYKESNLFLRGIIPQIGLRTAKVFYKRNVRVAGESKYPLMKMLNFSIDGITSFTSKPIRLIFTVGMLFLLLDLLVGAWVLTAHFSGHTITGWSSLMLSVWFLGSLVLIAIGIVGEYIGKIFIEVKGRPLYAVMETVGFNE
ncbi:MAG: glycosyltransferase family 2 protein [Muribaculaceae bacterium]|nr:glycosyltransferase family 2 protein [Muribaculaceae bacterium]MDE7142474.1 glycosyltransferase family 2 protein [Muribaculaceae bacterium]